ncbi:MAG: amidohydrolase, partial [Mycobacterium sp.]
MLITRAGLLDGTVADVRVGPTIRAVAPCLAPQAGEEVLDARGALLIPGLHDHHVHVR